MRKIHLHPLLWRRLSEVLRMEYRLRALAALQCREQLRPQNSMRTSMHANEFAYANTCVWPVAIQGRELSGSGPSVCPIGE